MSPLPIRFGVLGTGRITRRLVADLQSTPGATVSAIASRCAHRARWAADSHGIAAAVEGYERLLSRDDVDAVYIALPPSLHHEWTLAACAAGKHILCEKPVALSAREVSEMLDAANRADVRFLDATAWLHHERTFQFRQWLRTATPQPDTALAAAKPDELFADESAAASESLGFRVGPLRHVSAAVSFLNPFQNGDHRLDRSLGGGALLDLGWYAAGMIRFATGDLPKRVYATAVMRDGIDVRVSATMRFADETTATLSCGFDTSTRKWCEIAGAEASIVCDDFTRPWADKPARSWVHEASGKVHTFTPPSELDGLTNSGGITAPVSRPSRCHQEREMISRLIGWIRTDASADVEKPWQQFHDQALQTQTLLDTIAAAIE
ncbi:Gfo/Idh/MocA family protein [Allorhodopirellula heiligendammensis]|uniref:1,5-anhydro-D-fructose reductase n=1 Tax=Allorhodopirellula heiligendammensis TaxID=2714739 RepID=A0A5C6C374_9BACT|nr:Gfo/Idh/MocA family oxidoreductase [Allorhodopirellula heiligendammensis]TWU18467.1 1,5-anhydro-D-fructose reductase [Allorhodopirellula heiligendammensis]